MNNLRYRIALSLTKGVSAPLVRRIEEKGLEMEEFFNLPSRDLTMALGLNPNYVIAKESRDKALFEAEKQMAEMRSRGIRALFLSDDDYPMRLAQCHDAPIILYVKGDYDFSAEKYVAYVGTRRLTGYGDRFIRESIPALSLMVPDLCIVSGLAEGADAVSHKMALQEAIPTVAVVAHSLDRIYPEKNVVLAREILDKGGAIISEYPFPTPAYQGHFLARNRIVAGLSDAVMVVESGERGGALSTANRAFDYDREIFALPGRATDLMSVGCNNLIRKNKAHLATCADHIVKEMGWDGLGFAVSEPEEEAPSLSPDQMQIYELLQKEAVKMTMDEIHARIGGSLPRLMANLSDMEADGFISRLPGNSYELN